MPAAVERRMPAAAASSAVEEPIKLRYGDMNIFFNGGYKIRCARMAVAASSAAAASYDAAGADEDTAAIQN